MGVKVVGLDYLLLAFGRIASLQMLHRNNINSQKSLVSSMSILDVALFLLGPTAAPSTPAYTRLDIRLVACSKLPLRFRPPPFMLLLLFDVLESLHHHVTYPDRLRQQIRLWPTRATQPPHYQDSSRSFFEG